MMMDIAMNVLQGSIKIVRVFVSLSPPIAMTMITIMAPVSLATPGTPLSKMLVFQRYSSLSLIPFVTSSKVPNASDVPRGATSMTMASVFREILTANPTATIYAQNAIQDIS